MPRRKTKEEFISDAISVHGDTYGYNKVSYVNARTHVDIKCPIHGYFKQTPDGHLSGSGCNQCGNIQISKTETKDIDVFIKEANHKHGNKFDYSLSDYVSANSKITIICPLHGPFTQTPNNHLQYKYGCPCCANKGRGQSKRLGIGKFIERGRALHGDKFDYSKAVYEGWGEKMKIICPTHGAFWQSPASHLSGCGCRECSRRNQGWSRTKWFNNAKTSRYYKGFKVYILQIKSFGEIFYKIGRTFHRVKDRFSDMPNEYNYEILKIIDRKTLSKESCNYIYDLENKLHRLNSDYKYTPMIEFGGMEECYSSLEGIEDYL